MCVRVLTTTHLTGAAGVLDGVHQRANIHNPLGISAQLSHKCTAQCARVRLQSCLPAILLIRHYHQYVAKSMLYLFTTPVVTRLNHMY